MEDWIFLYWIFSDIFWENVLWSIDISAEFEVVDLSDISFVQIFSNENLEESLIWRNQA